MIAWGCRSLRFIGLTLSALVAFVGMVKWAGAKETQKMPSRSDDPPGAAISNATSATEVLVPLAIPQPHWPMMSPPQEYFCRNEYLPRPPFMVPKSVKLLSSHKKVVISERSLGFGEPEFVTDGNKEGMDGTYLEQAPGVQWVQIDLGQSCEVYAVVIWHWGWYRIYHDVVVRCSDDPNFGKSFRTLFNNDTDNSAGLGTGKDLEYVETPKGKLIDCKSKDGQPVRIRYLRFYSNGNTSDELNQYVEIEVYGRPYKAIVQDGRNASQ